jgi:hypothetical protein
MSTWKSEVLRSLVQLCYWAFYLYGRNHRKTTLTFVNDIMALASPDIYLQSDAVEVPEWLRRYFAGYTRRDGKYVYTIPAGDRLPKVLSYLHHSKVITPIATTDHALSLEAASKYAIERGYDRYGDQSYFEGRLRGQLFGSFYSKREIFRSVILVHLLPGESYFRAREVRIVFTRDYDEEPELFLSRSNSLIYDNYMVRDFFVATGASFGVLFSANSKSDEWIGNYKWDKKNNRILRFTAKLNSHSWIDYVLCQKRTEIDWSLKILQSVSEFRSVQKIEA